MALAACSEATTQAGWHEALPYPAERIGCIVATTASGADTVARELGILADKGERAVAALRVMLAGPDAAAVLISLELGIRGECYGMSGACAGGAMAIGHGIRLIRAGVADAVVVGGADAGSAELVKAMYRNLGAMSPSGQCRPFDVARDGFMPGEGAGILVLERAELARARNAPILAYAAGYGATSDAFHLTKPDPAGQQAALTAAMRDARLAPEDIVYVNAHGTGTPQNDSIETEVLAETFGDRGAAVPISSTKSAIGHLQGAAGAVEAIAALEVLRRNVAGPTVGLTDPDPALALQNLPTASTSLPPSENGRAAVLSNSFGLGGHNATLALTL